MSSDLVAPAKNNLRLIALAFNPENEDNKKENCKEQVLNDIKFTIAKHTGYDVLLFSGHFGLLLKCSNRTPPFEDASVFSFLSLETGIW